MAEEKPVGSCIVRPDTKPSGLNLSLLAYRSPSTSNAYVMNFKVRQQLAAGLWGSLASTTISTYRSDQSSFGQSN